MDPDSVPARNDESAPQAVRPGPDLSATVYGHLRAIAQNQMNGERAGHSLSATALVHEAYMRLAGDAKGPPVERGQYLYAAAEAMRRILIEHARARGAIKRGGGMSRASLDVIGDIADLASPGRGDEILAFDEAFLRLEGLHPRLASVVRLRFFAGLSIEETALELGVSDRTVNTHWAHARAWLARAMLRE